MEQKVFELIVRELEPSLDIADTALNKELLLAKINQLIINDFSRLISILRRIDVSEKKLKRLLRERTKTDAAHTILELMIERQVEKIKTKGGFKAEDGIPDDEKW